MLLNVKVSLIVTTYNWPEALDAVLRSVASQEVPPDEVLIADDGSSSETAAVVSRWGAMVHFPIRHVWQEDHGFQAAKIRNKAAAMATGDYLIFLDGDCLLRPGFVRRHIKFAEPGHFVAGNRVLLSRDFTLLSLEQGVPVEQWSTGRFRHDQIQRSWPLRTWPLGPLRKAFPRQWRGVKTCNLAVWKKDLVAVNGLDESFVGWGYEDSELVIRLLRQGVKRINGRFALTVLHLWHNAQDRSQERSNYLKLQEVINSNKRLAVSGIDQYL